MQNINNVTLTGNLTRDPELAGASTSVCKMRLAVNGRRKNRDTGQWEDEPNYFDVTVFGKQGESCAKYLAKGRPVAVSGRLSWREWTTQEGQKRQAVEVIAEVVQFLGDGKDGGLAPRASQSADVPVDTGDFSQEPAMAAADDDIPF